MKLKTSAAEMVANARKNIREYSAQQAIEALDDDSVTIVDLRDPRERDREGVIPGAFHCPRGMVEFWVDPESPYFKDIFAQNKTFLFHCASGWRSALTVQTLGEMGFDKAAHIESGFKGWKEAGGPVEKD